jgi:hypothetical protein
MRRISCLVSWVLALTIVGLANAQTINIMTTPPGSFTHTAGSAIAKVIVEKVATAISGIWFISAAVIGYTTRRIGALYRGVCAITGLGLLIPIGLFAGGRYLNVAGACLAIILLFTEFSARQKMKALALTSGSEGKE